MKMETFWVRHETKWNVTLEASILLDWHKLSNLQAAKLKVARPPSALRSIREAVYVVPRVRVGMTACRTVPVELPDSPSALHDSSTGFVSPNCEIFLSQDTCSWPSSEMVQLRSCNGTRENSYTAFIFHFLMQTNTYKFFLFCKKNRFGWNTLNVSWRTHCTQQRVLISWKSLRQP